MLFEKDSRRLDLNECRRIVAKMVRDSSVSDDYVHEFLLDEVSRNGDEVFNLEWDSRGPGGGAGVEVVVRFRGRLFTLSPNVGLRGPWPSVEAAIRGLFGIDRERPILINDATVSISCTEWEGDELISKINLDWRSLPAELDINGEHWYLEELERAQRKMDESSGESS